MQFAIGDTAPLMSGGSLMNVLLVDSNVQTEDHARPFARGFIALRCVDAVVTQMKRWLCLDCGKNTFENNEDYYGLRNRLWRRLVPREERHGMLCRACVERRLGRPLAPDDFRTGRADDESDPEDQPMTEDDYGIYDSLSPETLQAIDAVMIGFVSARPRKVARVVRVVRYMYEQSLASIPELHDWFYFDRIGQLIENGVLVVVTEEEDPRFHLVRVSAPDRRDLPPGVP